MSAAARPPATNDVVQRTLTIDELRRLDRCLACGDLALTGGVDPHVAEGAIVELDEDLPRLRLCPRCADVHVRGLRWGERAVLGLTIAAPAAPMVASVLTPTTTPWGVVAAAIGALLVARGLERIAYRRRSSSCMALVVDGDGLEVTVQVPEHTRSAVTHTGGVYRVAERADDRGVRARAYPPRRGFPWPFVLATTATCLVTLVAWHGGYPAVVIDAPKETATVYIDDDHEGIHVPAGQRRVVPMAWGRHRIAVVDEAGAARKLDVRLPWGRSHLLATDPSHCYELTPERPLTATFGRVVHGTWVSIDGPDGVRRAACAPSTLW